MFTPGSTINVSTAALALSQGLDAINAGQVEFDLVAVTEVDSAAVAVLLAWQRASHARHVNLNFKNIPRNLQSLAKLYGVDDLLHAILTPVQSH